MQDFPHLLVDGAGAAVGDGWFCPAADGGGAADSCPKQAQNLFIQVECKEKKPSPRPPVSATTDYPRTRNRRPESFAHPRGDGRIEVEDTNPNSRLSSEKLLRETKKTVESREPKAKTVESREQKRPASSVQRKNVQGLLKNGKTGSLMPLLSHHPSVVLDLLLQERGKSLYLSA